MLMSPLMTKIPLIKLFKNENKKMLYKKINKNKIKIKTGFFFFGF
jgi:hypothetical protein